MNEIIERLQREADEAKQEYISQICQIVIRHIKDCPADAERITTDKTLAGCFTFLRDRAKKNQKNGCGVCGDADAERAGPIETACSYRGKTAGDGGFQH